MNFVPPIAWMPSFWEGLLIFAALLLLFGARKLPDLARALGKSLGEFKKGKEEGERGLNDRTATKDEKEDPAK